MHCHPQFEIFRGAVSAGTVTELRALYDEAGAALDKLVPSPLQPIRQWQAYRAVSLPTAAGLPDGEARVAAVLSKLSWLLEDMAVRLGSEAILMTHLCAYRPQAPGRTQFELPWHQDVMIYGEDVLSWTCWIALDDCGTDAAGLEFPDLATPAPVFDFAARPPGRIPFDFDAWVCAQGDVAVTTPVYRAGDMAIFAGTQLHRTQMISGMDRPRLAFELRFLAHLPRARRRLSSNSPRPRFVTWGYDVPR